MKVISTERIPIKIWATDLEEGALEQAKNLANLPFAFHHIAIIADGHRGYGMPIGGVMATKGVVVPNAVGVDIGCGMVATKTSLTDIDTATLKKIMGEIRKSVPVGFNKHKEAQSMMWMPTIGGSPAWNHHFDEDYPIVGIQYKNALKSVGTLGGGNHFIEIQKGSDNHIWIMIHSGSRNLGLQVAKYYNDLAKKLVKKWHSSVDPKWDLAFLPLDSSEGKSYIREMEYCVEFALGNRKLMMDRICKIFNKETHCVFSDYDNKNNGMINIAHNYAAMENYFGQNVMVHRKGATRAYEGELGIIPGSQGTKSYIVRGKGNSDSFKSCSHGAGRLYSRKKCKEELDLEAEKKILDDQGIIHGIRNISDLDEAPSAYKNIDTVMSNQTDLVDILVELTPLAVIKG